MDHRPHRYHLIENNQARVIGVAGDPARDVTSLYRERLRADQRAARIDLVDVTNPNDSSQLGPTWYKSEREFRWMPKTATVKLSGPTSAAQKFYANGFAPAALVAAGPSNT